MQPLNYYYYNVLESFEKPSDVPAVQLQEGYDLLYRYGGRVEIDLIERAQTAQAEGQSFPWYDALDDEQRDKLRQALSDTNPAKILKLMQRSGYASVLYQHARKGYQPEQPEASQATP